MDCHNTKNEYNHSDSLVFLEYHKYEYADKNAWQTTVFELQKKVEEAFVSNFGRTPLRQRIEDIRRMFLILLEYIC